MTTDRRRFLGAMAGLPLMPRLLAGAAAGGGGDRDRSLILLWMDGGMSHLDTFDGKPEASAVIRGDLRPARCGLEGVFLSEHLPQLGKVIDRCALVRSITHGEGNHDRGSHYLLTGRRPSPVLEHPALGAIVSHERDSRGLPSYVAVPDAPQYGGQGFLPLSSGPFEVGGDPGRPDFRVRDLDPRPRAQAALALLEELDRLDAGARSEAEAARDRFLEQASRMSLDPDVRRLFDLGAEPAEIRARYGRHRLGQSCLLARRLAEGGVGCVLVRDVGWDHHVNVARAMTYGFPPKLTALDQALSALIADLERRELADRVVVCLASEFGRTPRLNPAAGRDHWPRAQSALLCGAGIRRGTVFGETDPRGEEPQALPRSPADLFATLLAALRLDPEKVLHTPDGRPVRLVEPGAEPIAEVLAP